MILVARRPLLPFTFSWRLPFTRQRKHRRAAQEVTHRFTIHLAAGASELVPPCDRSIVVHCNRGTVWITQDGELKDVILNPGESFTPQRTRDMLLHSLHSCELLMQFSR